MYGFIILINAHFSTLSGLATVQFFRLFGGATFRDGLRRSTKLAEEEQAIVSTQDCGEFSRDV